MPLPNWPSSSGGGSSAGTSISLTVATVSITAPEKAAPPLDFSVEWSVDDPTNSPDTETCATTSGTPS